MRNKDGGIYYPCSCVKHKNSNVYVTDYGTFYHENPGCYRLKRSVSKISGQKLVPVIRAISVQLMQNNDVSVRE